MNTIPDQEDRTIRGDNHFLAVTTKTDEITGDTKPLFGFAVQICKATDDKEPSFDIAAPSGAPRKQQFVDEATGELITDDQCQRGIRFGDDFKPIDPDAIAEINKATKLTTMFVHGKIDYSTMLAKYGDRITGAYFVQSPAKGGSPKSYRLLYETLRADKKAKRPAKALVVKRTPRSRQVLGAVYANEELGCLMMVQMRFAGSLRTPDEQVLAPQLAQVEQAQIDKARLVIDGLPDGETAINTLGDDAIPLRQELIEKALDGQTITAPTPVAESVEADSLEEMLEASLAAA